MVLGTVLVLAALSLFLWNRAEDRRAGESVQQVLPMVIRQIEAPPAETAAEPETAQDAAETDAAQPAPVLPDPYDPTMRETQIDGYSYIGYLSIPALELELPVLAECDDARLKIAPCRYAGSAKTDDLVIAAHNYTQHFGSLSKLTAGDAVYLTDMDGVTIAYTAAVIEVLEATDVEEMTDGTYDLTLFTCTYGGQSRVTVRCDRAAE